MTRWSLRWATQPARVGIAALAAFRLAHLVTVENGAPFTALHDTIRLRLEAAHSERLRRIGGHRALAPAERLSEHPATPLLTCPVCVGFWASLAVVALTSAPRPVANVWRPVSVALALSTVPIVVSKLNREG